MELVKAADALQAQGNQVIHLSIGTIKAIFKYRYLHTKL